MSQSVSNAVAQRDQQPAGNAVIERYRNVFAEVLPTHIKPETWVRVAQGALRRDEKLAVAAANNPESLIASLLDAARRGLEPGTEQYYLVPYKGQVQGIVGFQGEVELMYRAGAISSVIVEVVYEKDTFQYSPGRDDRPLHEIDWDADDRGPLRLVYAYAAMKDGATSRVVVMNRSEVMRHKAMAQGTDRPDSPWKKWESAMWLKTAAHELTKWVPTSAEYLRDQARALGETIRTATKPTSAPPAAGPRPPQQQPGEVRQEPVRAQVIDGALAEGEPVMSDDQSRKMFATFNDAGLKDKDQQLAYIAQVVGREIQSRKELTAGEASRVIESLTRYVSQQEPPAGDQ